jgi:hypothetical protein
MASSAKNTNLVFRGKYRIGSDKIYHDSGRNGLCWFGYPEIKGFPGN